MNIIYLKRKSKWVLSLQLDFLSNSPVEYIYNPIEYARETHQMYLRLYADSAPKKIVFLGMNPGPFGNFGFLVYPSFRPSIFSPVCLYAYPLDCLSVYLSVCPSVRPSVRPSIRPSLCSPVCLYSYLSVFISAYLSICRSVYLYVCLNFNGL
jgi:hypothetical protein